MTTSRDRCHAIDRGGLPDGAAGIKAGLLRVLADNDERIDAGCLAFVRRTRAG